MTHFFVSSPCLNISLFLLFCLGVSNLGVYVFYVNFSANKYFIPNEYMSSGNFTYYAVLPQELQNQITLWGFDYIFIQSACIGLLLGSVFAFFYVAYVRSQITALVHIFGIIAVLFFDLIRSGWIIWVMQDGSNYWYYFTPGYSSPVLTRSTEFTILMWVSVYSVGQSVVQLIIHLIVSKSYEEVKEAEQMQGIPVSSSIFGASINKRGRKKRKSKASNSTSQDYDECNTRYSDEEF